MKPAPPVTKALMFAPIRGGAEPSIWAEMWESPFRLRKQSAFSSFLGLV